MPYTQRERKVYDGLVARHGEEQGKEIYYKMESMAKKGKKFGKLFSAKTKGTK